MQPSLFEEWIEKGYQRDANLCGACARSTDERSLVRGGGVYILWVLFVCFFVVIKPENPYFDHLHILFVCLFVCLLFCSRRKWEGGVFRLILRSDFPY